MSRRAFAIAAALSIFAVAADAAVINSVDRATFAAALASGTLNSQNFDSFADGTPLVGPQSGVAFAAAEGTVIVTNQFLTSTNPNGIGSTATEASNNGDRFFTETNSVTITFANPITAFAIDINTFATVGGAYRAILNTGNAVDSIFQTFSGQNTGQFIGFVSDTGFTSLVISAIADADFTLDTLVFGDSAALTTIVPAPGAVLLFATGLGAFGAARRLKRG